MFNLSETPEAAPQSFDTKQTRNSLGLVDWFIHWAHRLMGLALWVQVRLATLTSMEDSD